MNYDSGLFGVSGEIWLFVDHVWYDQEGWLFGGLLVALREEDGGGGGY